MASKVYFSSKITPENVVELYKRLGVELEGNVAVKLHSGEKGNQNFLKPEFWKPIIDHVNGTPVECNTAYDGSRNTTERHLATLKLHKWMDYFDMELLDADGEEIELDIPSGKTIQKNYIGKGFDKYNSMLVLSHFKGHPMGGFGGAIKQLSIGCASAHGKAYIHGAGKTENIWSTPQDDFLSSMADAAGSVITYFDKKIAYINVMKNMSVDCDCCEVAEDPCMADIGILASLDPIAIDQACLDIVYKSNDPGRDHFLERVESRHGIYTVECAAEQGYGSREYEFISID